MSSAVEERNVHGATNQDLADVRLHLFLLVVVRAVIAALLAATAGCATLLMSRAGWYLAGATLIGVALLFYCQKRIAGRIVEAPGLRTTQLENAQAERQAGWPTIWLSLPVVVLLARANDIGTASRFMLVGSLIPFALSLSRAEQSLTHMLHRLADRTESEEVCEKWDTLCRLTRRMALVFEISVLSTLAVLFWIFVFPFVPGLVMGLLVVTGFLLLAVLVNSVRTTVYALRLSERLQRVTAEDLRSPAGGTGRGPSG